MGSQPPGSFRFSRDQRLRKRWEFLQTQRLGDRYHSRRFILYIRPGATTRTRLGITTSRKVGRAVERNRIRRWIREVFRQHPDLFPRPVDLVVIAKKGLDDWSYDAVRDDFTDVITRYFEDPPRRAGHRSRRGGKRRRPGRRRGGEDPDRAV